MILFFCSAPVAASAEDAIREENSHSPFPHPKLRPEYIPFASNKILRDELERVEKGIQIDAINTQKFRLEPPRQGDGATVEDWERSTMNAKAQLENQYLRIINLELMLRFCRNSWVIHNYQLEWCKTLFKDHLEKGQESIQRVNKERKSDQVGQKQYIRKVHTPPQITPNPNPQVRYARSLQALAYTYRTPIDD